MLRWVFYRFLHQHQNRLVTWPRYLDALWWQVLKMNFSTSIIKRKKLALTTYGYWGIVEYQLSLCKLKNVQYSLSEETYTLLQRCQLYRPNPVAGLDTCHLVLQPCVYHNRQLNMEWSSQLSWNCVGWHTVHTNPLKPTYTWSFQGTPNGVRAMWRNCHNIWKKKTPRLCFVWCGVPPFTSSTSLPQLWEASSHSIG